DAEPERRQHPGQGAAVGGQDDARPEVADPDPRLPGGGGRRLPGHADLGQEAVAGPARLGEHLVAPVAVIPDRRPRQERLRRAVEGGQRLRQQRRPPHPAVPDPGLLGVVPPFAPDALPRQMDDGADPLQSPGVDAALVGVPADGITRRRRPDHGDHPVPGPPQRSPERRPDEPARPADDDIHEHAPPRPPAPPANYAVPPREGRGWTLAGPYERP